MKLEEVKTLPDKELQTKAEELDGWWRFQVEGSSAWSWIKTITGEGFSYSLPGPPPDYLNDIAAAWPLHKTACGWLFSKRRTYLATLELLCRDREKAYIAWPDALVFLSAKNIIRAFVFCNDALNGKRGTYPDEKTEKQ